MNAAYIWDNRHYLDLWKYTYNHCMYKLYVYTYSPISECCNLVLPPLEFCVAYLSVYTYSIENLLLIFHIIFLRNDGEVAKLRVPPTVWCDCQEIIFVQPFCYFSNISYTSVCCFRPKINPQDSYPTNFRRPVGTLIRYIIRRTSKSHPAHLPLFWPQDAAPNSERYNAKLYP